MKIAAIDIGSNAARLLIQEVSESGSEPVFTKLNMLRIPLRLGMDVFANAEIGDARKLMMLESMAVFSRLMKIYEVEKYLACATSAMRDAKNGQEIIEAVKEYAGIEIEIISGDREAALLFENHIAESLDKNFVYLYIDVGGGSTELTFFENGEMTVGHSFNLGTIRLLNGTAEETEWLELKNYLKKNISGKKPIMAIGSGGNINKIFSMSKVKDGVPMSALSLKKLEKEMAKFSVDERMKNYKLREDRADVILPALKIFNSILNWGGIKHILVPKISVADGLVQHIYHQPEEAKSFQLETEMEEETP